MDPDRRIRITIVQGPFLPIPPIAGGAIEKRFFSLAQYWASVGNEVTHVSRCYKGFPEREVMNGVRHLRIRSSEFRGNVLIDKLSDALYSIRALRSLPEADILITHTFFLPVLARARKRCGSVYVYVGRFPKRQLGFYQNVARIQFPSRAAMNAAIRQSPTLASKYIVIPNALPYTPSTVAPRKPLFPPYKLLYAGRIHPEKGLEVLLNSLVLLPRDLQRSIALRIVGPIEKSSGGGGSAYFSLLKQIAARTEAKVELLGPLFDPEALAREYVSADLFVYPSLAERGESFGVAPLEALSHGTPALVSALECFAEFIAPEQNGFVFNHRTADPARALADAMISVLSRADRWPLFATEAYKSAQRFRLELIGEAYLGDFRNIMLSAGSPHR